MHGNNYTQKRREKLVDAEIIKTKFLLKRL